MEEQQVDGEIDSMNLFREFLLLQYSSSLTTVFSKKFQFSPPITEHVVQQVHNQFISFAVAKTTMKDVRTF